MKQKLLNIISFHNSVLAKYFTLSVVSIFLAIFFIIGLIVFGNQFVLTVQESIERGIPIQELIPIIGFNMIRDVPLILALSLFLAIIVSLSQFYKSSEAIVMNSIGLGGKHFWYFFQPFVLIIFVFALFLTLYIVPSVKNQKNIMEEETKNSSEFSFITEGEFEQFKDGEIVFYASDSKIASQELEQNMEEVFIYSYSKGDPVVILASEATKYSNFKTKSIYLRLKDGVRYQGIPGGSKKNILEFELYDLEIVSGNVHDLAIAPTLIEGMGSIDLFLQGDRKAAAELQWRLSQPISILILSIIAVILGKTSPRNAKGVNLLIGIVVFILYNNGLLVIKKAIESGELNPFIGFFGGHLVILIVLLLAYHFRKLKFIKYVDKIVSFNLKKKSHV